MQLLHAAIKRQKPFVFDSAILPKLTQFTRQHVTRLDLPHIESYHHNVGWLQGASKIHPCFLHMLAFKQHMDLMLDRDFPFALLGLVHLENSITLHAPIEPEATGFLSSHFRHFARHDKGISFEISSEFEQNHNLRWSSVSRFLAIDSRLRTSKRKSEPDDDTVFTTMTELSCTSDTGRKYAKVSGDYNLIHLWPVTARLFGFKRAIAHGMWSKARCLSLLMAEKPSLSSCSVKFQRPLFLPSQTLLQTYDSHGASEDSFRLFSPTTNTVHLTGQFSCF